MKKIYLLLTFALMALVAGAQTEYSYNFFLGGFTKTNDTKVFDGIEWTLESDCANPGQHLYLGQQFDNTTTVVIKTTAFKGVIPTIKLDAGIEDWSYGDKATMSVSVGETSYKADDHLGHKQQVDVALISTGRSYIFTGNSEGEIVISFSNQSDKPIILSSIALTFGGSVTPDVPEVLEPVVFSLEQGVYTSTQTLELTCATPDASIIYELWKNGTAIDAGAKKAPMTLTLEYEEGKQNEYIVRAFSNKNPESTAQQSRKYSIGKRCPNADFSKISGTYYGSQSVEVSTIMKGDYAGFIYSFYKDGKEIANTVKYEQSLPFTLAAEPGKEIRYVINATVVNGPEGFLESERVSHEYIIREAGIDRVFEKVTDAGDLTNYSNFTLITAKGDYVIGGYDAGYKNYAGVKLNPTVTDTYTHGEGAAILKLEPVKGKNAFYIKNEGTAKYLQLVVNASGKYEFYEVDIPDAKAEWTINDKMEIQNLAVGKDFVSFNPGPKVFNYYKGSNDLQIFKEKGTGARVAAEPAFSLPEGTYIADKKLVISSNIPGASICYSVKKDGWEMIKETTAEAPVEVKLTYAEEGTTYVIEAYALAAGYNPSKKVTKTYTLKKICGDEFLAAQIVISEIAELNGWQNGKQYKTFSVVDIHGTEITLTNQGGGNDGKYYVSDQTWRNYKDGNLSISLPQGYYLNRVEIIAGGNVAAGTFEKGIYGEAPYKNAWTATDYTNVMNYHNSTKAKNRVDFKGFNIYYTTTISGVEEAVAAETDVCGVVGGVKVLANAEAEVAVYTLAGQMVGKYNVAEGETMIELPQGFYIVRANEKAAKVIVK